jgi:uncharacterized RDD family membrane protein YckC
MPDNPRARRYGGIEPTGPQRGEARPLPWRREGEEFVVETPELTQIRFEIADFGSRFTAAVIDRLFLTLIALLFAIVGFLSIPTLGSSPGYATAFSTAMWFVVSMFYFVLFEYLRDGRTPGKRSQGLRSIHITGRGLDLQSALVRNLARVVDELPPMWIVPIVTEGRRRFGDMLGSTLVIRDAQAKPPKVAGKIARATRESLGGFAFAIPPAALDKLQPDDLNLIEYLDERVRNNTQGQQKRILAEVARRYANRLELDEHVAQAEREPVRFLQELLVRCRERFEHNDEI